MKCCEVIIWAKFGHLKGLLSGPSEGYYLGQVCFLPYSVVSSDFLQTQLSFCVFLVPNYQPITFFSKLAFFKKQVQKLGFSIFSVLSLSFENSLFWFARTL